MARSSSKLAAFLAVLVLVLEASSSSMLAAARRHHHHHHHHHHDGKPDPCRDGGVPGLLGHHGKDHHGCSSPAVSPHGGTRAVMTVNGFDKGEDGGGPSECDGKYHRDSEMLAALSTGWYAGGRRCHKRIRITSVHTGRTVEARVVDECDSRHGCKNNIVDTSKAVWRALGLDTDIGEVPVTWSDA